MKSNTGNAIILTGVIVLMALGAVFLAKPSLFSISREDKLNSALSEIDALKNKYLADLDSIKANLPRKELSLSELYDANKNATLYLRNEVDGRSGSGFFISKDGILVTNYHVVESTRPGDWVAQNPNGYMYRISKIVGGDPTKDYAILQIRDPGFDVEYLEIEDGAVRIGQKCFAIGSPLSEKFTLSEGVVSQLREFGETRYIQNTAQIAPGSSGGPLFNQSGKVIGVTTAIRKDNFGNLNQADINIAVDIKELNLSMIGNSVTYSDLSLHIADENESKEKLRSILLEYMKLYYLRLDNGDIRAIESMFAGDLYYFFGRKHVTKSEVMESIKGGSANIKNRSTSILPESFEIELVNEGLKVTYDVNYAFTNFNNDLNIFNLEMIVHLNEEGNISSMWEENVRKLN